MGFISSLVQMFKSEPVEVVGKTLEYKGYSIEVKPRPVNGQFGVGARITKVIDSVLKEHMFIRADSLPSKEVCEEVTLNKARMTLDQMGDRIFG